MVNETGIPESNLNQAQTTLNPAATSFHLQPPRLQHIPSIMLPNMDTNAHIITPELQEAIKNIVQTILNKNNEQEHLVDVTIEDRSNIDELDKIPDIVKCLREFSGNITEYSSWRKSVDRIFEIYDHTKGTAKYFGILSVVRNKIIGQANVVLESYNTPLNWVAIKRCLNTHYADKRDIGTLEYQLTTLIQGNRTIDNFYQQVYNHFSLILNKISSVGYDKSTENILVDSVATSSGS